MCAMADEQRQGGEWRPRPHDHLVEPLFGGLEAGERPAQDREPRREPRRSWLVRLQGRFLRFFSRGGARRHG
jgi:hypothetical protein